MTCGAPMPTPTRRTPNSCPQIGSGRAAGTSDRESSFRSHWATGKHSRLMLASLMLARQTKLQPNEKEKKC